MSTVKTPNIVSEPTTFYLDFILTSRTSAFEEYIVFSDADHIRVLKNEEQIPWTVYLGIAGMPGMYTCNYWRVYLLIPLCTLRSDSLLRVEGILGCQEG